MSARGILLAVLLIALTTVGACARKPAAPVTPGVDRYPDFALPLVPEDVRQAAGALVNPHQAAWRSLQAGDARAAERGFTAVLSKRADFYPAETGLGYVELARNNPKRAAERFGRALTRAPRYVPALVGRGQALLAANRPDEALAAFEAALAVDRTLADVRRRVETLRFRVLEGALGDARAAESSGDLERARAAFSKAVAASPESGFLHRDLARVEQKLGRLDEALAHAQKALALDPSDGAAFAILADVHEAKGELTQAIAALEKARALDAVHDVDARLAALRSRAELEGLPEEYRAIPATDRLTRGELASLIGVRFDALLQEVRRPQSALVTDIRSHWAQPWILAVARARVMDVFENHTFQPRSIVRRGDLARAVSGLLTLIAQRDPALARLWTGARRKFTDLGPGNLYYPAASLSVTAGVLDVLDGEHFRAGQIVSGAEAIEALERLEKLKERARQPAR